VIMTSVMLTKLSQVSRGGMGGMVAFRYVYRLRINAEKVTKCTYLHSWSRMTICFS
jgi:hypothetical protein